MTYKKDEAYGLLYVLDNGGPENGGTIDRYTIQLEDAMITTNSIASVWDYSPDTYLLADEIVESTHGKPIKWTDLPTHLQVVINIYNDKFYFYNGFKEPQLFNWMNIKLESNYLGDLTDDILELHNTYMSESDLDYNEQLSYFNIFRNPSYEELKAVNARYGLNENTYIEMFR